MDIKSTLLDLEVMGSNTFQDKLGCVLFVHDLPNMV